MNNFTHMDDLESKLTARRSVYMEYQNGRLVEVPWKLPNQSPERWKKNSDLPQQLLKEKERINDKWIPIDNLWYDIIRRDRLNRRENRKERAKLTGEPYKDSSSSFSSRSESSSSSLDQRNRYRNKRRNHRYKPSSSSSSYSSSSSDSSSYSSSSSSSYSSSSSSISQSHESKQVTRYRSYKSKSRSLSKYSRRNTGLLQQQRYPKVRRSRSLEVYRSTKQMNSTQKSRDMVREINRRRGRSSIRSKSQSVSRSNRLRVQKRLSKERILLNHRGGNHNNHHYQNRNRNQQQQQQQQYSLNQQQSHQKNSNQVVRRYHSPSRRSRSKRRNYRPYKKHYKETEKTHKRTDLVTEKTEGREVEEEEQEQINQKNQINMNPSPKKDLLEKINDSPNKEIEVEEEEKVEKNEIIANSQPEKDSAAEIGNDSPFKESIEQPEALLQFEEGQVERIEVPLETIEVPIETIEEPIETIKEMEEQDVIPETPRIVLPIQSEEQIVKEENTRKKKEKKERVKKEKKQKKEKDYEEEIQKKNSKKRWNKKQFNLRKLVRYIQEELGIDINDYNGMKALKSYFAALAAREVRNMEQQQQQEQISQQISNPQPVVLGEFDNHFTYSIPIRLPPPFPNSSKRKIRKAISKFNDKQRAVEQTIEADLTSLQSQQKSAYPIHTNLPDNHNIKNESQQQQQQQQQNPSFRGFNQGLRFGEPVKEYESGSARMDRELPKLEPSLFRTSMLLSHSLRQKLVRKEEKEENLPKIPKFFPKGFVPGTRRPYYAKSRKQQSYYIPKRAFSTTTTMPRTTKVTTYKYTRIEKAKLNAQKMPVLAPPSLSLSIIKQARKSLPILNLKPSLDVVRNLQKPISVRDQDLLEEERKEEETPEIISNQFRNSILNIVLERRRKALVSSALVNIGNNQSSVCTETTNIDLTEEQQQQLKETIEDFEKKQEKSCLKICANEKEEEEEVVEQDGIKMELEENKQCETSQDKDDEDLIDSPSLVDDYKPTESRVVKPRLQLSGIKSKDHSVVAIPILELPKFDWNRMKSNSSSNDSFITISDSNDDIQEAIEAFQERQVKEKPKLIIKPRLKLDFQPKREQKSSKQQEDISEEQQKLNQQLTEDKKRECDMMILEEQSAEEQQEVLFQSSIKENAEIRSLIEINIEEDANNTGDMKEERIDDHSNTYEVNVTGLNSLNTNVIQRVNALPVEKLVERCLSFLQMKQHVLPDTRDNNNN